MLTRDGALLKRATVLMACSATLLAFVVALCVASPVAAEPGLSPAQAMPSLVGSGSVSGSSYGALSCASSSTCTAVGPSAPAGFISTSVAPSAVDETSGAWGTPTAISPPAGAATSGQPHLDAVSCSASGNCAAVGDYPIEAGGVGAMAAEEVGGTWSHATAIQLPADALTGSTEAAALAGDWCDPLGNCIAVGTYHAANGLFPMVTTEAAGTWSAASRLPLFSGLKEPFGYSVTGLACNSVTDCTLVGDYTYANGFSVVPFSDQETAGTWMPPQFIPQPSLVFFTVNAIACPSVTQCLGVGGADYVTRRKDVEFGSWHPAYVVEDHGVWSTVKRLAEPDLSPVTDEGELTSIACAAGGSCEAVGDAYNKHSIQRYPLAVSYVRGRWSSGAVQASAPLGTTMKADYSAFQAVSCGGPAACVGVGSAALNPWADPPYTHQPLFPFWTQLTVARPLRVPRPPIQVRVNSGIGAAEVSWQPPADDGGAPIAFFIASVSSGGPRCIAVAHSCFVHGLTNDHVYTFSVIDRTGYAESLPSMRVRIRVGVPTPPQGVRVAVGAGFADVVWRPSSSPPAEPILAYDVVAIGHGEHLHCRSTKPSCRIRRGLVSDAEYAVVVTATDKSGTSRPSARINFIAN